MSVSVKDLQKELDEYGVRCSLEGNEPDGTPSYVAAMNRIMSEMKMAHQLPLLDQMRFLGFKSLEEAQFIHLIDMHMIGLGFKQVSFDHPDIPNGHRFLYIKWSPANKTSYNVVYRHVIGSERQGTWFIMYGNEPIRCVDCGNLWKNMEVIQIATVLAPPLDEE